MVLRLFVINNVFLKYESRQKFNALVGASIVSMSKLMNSV